MKKIWWALLVMSLTRGAFPADVLTLNTYLSDVRMACGYQGVNETVQALELQKEESERLFSPQLVARAIRNDNRDEQTGLTSDGNEIIRRSKTDDYGVALVKKWKSGLTTAVNYDWTRIDNSADTGSSTTFQARPSASVTLPLWRDLLGKQSRANNDQLQLQMEASRLSALHQRQRWLYEARLAYWSLQLAREKTAICRDTLARSVSILAWSKRRSALSLGEDTEIIQARANQSVRELELQQVLELEKTASSEFNRYRGTAGMVVLENLEDLDSSLAILAFQWSDQTPKNWDLKASEAQMEARKAAWDSAKSDIEPDLNAFTSVSSTGSQSSFGAASDEGFQARRPNTVIGARLTIPLDVFKAKRVAGGYERSYLAAVLEYKDKVLQSEREWCRLHQRLDDVNQRLVMAKAIEVIQKEKVEKEQQRLRAGRTTQYQVQSYEGDYSSARLQRLSIQAEKLALWAEGEWILSAEHEETASSEGASK